MAATYQRAFSTATQHGNSQQLIVGKPKDEPVLTNTERIVRLFITILCGLLIIRFVLSLFGASSTNSIVSLIYDVTAPVISPFRSMFADEPTLGAARFEIETLVTIIALLLLGAGVTMVINLFRKR